jgi:hypothetical protein
MKLGIGRTGIALALALCAIGTPAAAQQRGLSNVEKAGEALQISNIMGRYSIYVVANRWTELGDMFALDEPDVRQNVPSLMSGPAVRKYFTERAAARVSDGVMHQHSFLAPIIEVAGDGQTAKGVWDSPGLDTGSGNNMANWAWVRYAVDFKKINGAWKIWHLSVWPLWRAPYGEAWSSLVQQASGGKMTGGAAPAAAPTGAAPGQPGPSAGGPNPRGPGAAGARPGQQEAPKWRYNGVGEFPMIPVNPPKPYYTFDPKDAY